MRIWHEWGLFAAEPNAAPSLPPAPILSKKIRVLAYYPLYSRRRSPVKRAGSSNKYIRLQDSSYDKPDE